MNGFAEAAIGLAFATQLLALETTLTAHFFDLEAKPQPARIEIQAAKVLATQKLMRNPWDRAAQPAEESYRAK